jgi:hypothetical protein
VHCLWIHTTIPHHKEEEEEEDEKEEIGIDFKALLCWAGRMLFLSRTAPRVPYLRELWCGRATNSFRRGGGGWHQTATTTTTCIGTSLSAFSTLKDEDSARTPSSSSTTRSAGVESWGGDKHPLYLHVGPSGDCWTGPSIFAAKHLPPDYVKSIPLDESLVGDVDRLLELLEGGDDDDNDGQVWTRIIYDEGILPPKLLVRLREVQNVV